MQGLNHKIFLYEANFFPFENIWIYGICTIPCSESCKQNDVHEIMPLLQMPWPGRISDTFTPRSYRCQDILYRTTNSLYYLHNILASLNPASPTCNTCINCLSEGHYPASLTSYFHNHLLIHSMLIVTGVTQMILWPYINCVPYHESM